MKKIKVSVIVPCYNVEDYLRKSIESLLNQTLENIEIIAINDGSTDKTGEILDKLASDDKRLKVFHTENNGVSHARNFALSIAKGDYIAFLDSDDWLKEDALKKMYSKAVEDSLDIVACDTTAVYPNKDVIIHSNVDVSCTERELMTNAYAVLWNKLYRKDILKGINFNENITFCEDVLYLYEVYTRVKKAGAIAEPLHYYLQRTGSLTNVYDKKIYNIIECMDGVVARYKDLKVYKKYKNEVEYSYIRYLYATFMKRLSKTKDLNKYMDGYNLVKAKVQKQFPNYRKNKYLEKSGFKNLYLKAFNKFFAYGVFLFEKNKMN